jgi:hypothetical protein
MGNYISIRPSDRDDLFEKITKLVGSVVFASLPLFMLFNSGMGSGKSRISAKTSTQLKGFKGLVVVIEKDQNLKNQMEKAFLEYVDSCAARLITFDKAPDATIYEISTVLESGKIPILFLKNVRHSKGQFTPSAKLLEQVLNAFNSIDKLCFIDELPNQITELTGGINAKLDHTSGIMESYNKAISQTESLNIFDMLRKYNVKCISLSGTTNNVICSKLPSLGYDAKDICVVNVYPIEALYSKLKITNIDVNKFDLLVGRLIEFEKSNSDSKCIIAVQNKKAITNFKRSYHRVFGRKISSVEITGENEKERVSAGFIPKLREAKYVFGIRMIDTGFDLSTWVKGQQFSLGILYSRKSDAISWPLSKNKEHDFHMDTAASLMQLFARMREGGEWLIPEKLDSRPLYDRLLQVYDIISRCNSEFDWVGAISYNTQRGRVYQCLVLALIQNIRQDNDNRPIVDGILTHLKEMTGRCFETEVKTNIGAAFDHEFWATALACLWDTWNDENNPTLNEDKKGENRRCAFSRFRRGEYTSGRGFRVGRTYDEQQVDLIWARAGTDQICGHCGESGLGLDTQLCHMQTFAAGGNKTNVATNCFIGHRDCDSMFDCNSIVYDIDRKTVWLNRHAKINKPHRAQLDCISSDNFEARWLDQKTRFKQDKGCDDNFREFLKSKGFISIVY